MRVSYSRDKKHKHNERRKQQDDAVLEAGQDTVRAELAGHDARECAKDDPDPEHVGRVTRDIHGNVLSFETGKEWHVELVGSIEIDPKGEVDDHHVDDGRVLPFALEFEVMLEIGNRDHEDLAQVGGDLAGPDQKGDGTLDRDKADPLFHPDISREALDRSRDTLPFGSGRGKDLQKIFCIRPRLCQSVLFIMYVMLWLLVLVAVRLL